VEDLFMASDSSSSPALITRHRTLSGFLTAVSRAHGIGLRSLDALTTLVVRTRNSAYRITMITPHRGEVLVQGGRFFGAPTRACLNGSSSGGSCLRLGWMGVGLHLEFHAEERWIVTSRVRSIEVEPPATGRPC
jgi:hypothetical protein